MSSPEQLRRIREIVTAALERSPAQRSALLELAGIDQQQSHGLPPWGQVAHASFTDPESGATSYVPISASRTLRRRVPQQ
jgi:hypothetical protein